MANKDKINESSRKYRLKNKEKIKESKRKYRLKNKEKQKEYNRKYELENKEKIKERKRKYELKNKEKIKERKRKYFQSELGKRFRIYKWKCNGIIDNYNDNYETIYRIYSIQKMCSICYKVFNNEKRIDFKCVDHCHLTGKIRRICCNYCNLNIVK